MYPYVLKNSLNSNSMNSSIGFTVAVVDSFGHAILFASPGQYSEMTFVSTLALQAVLLQGVGASRIVRLRHIASRPET